LSRTLVVILAVAIAAVLAAVIVLLVWRPFDDGPAIQTGAPGVWQEQTASQPMRLTVSTASDEADGTDYWVQFAGAPAEPLPARLDGEQILVLDADSRDTRWVFVYDEGADALIVTPRDGGETNVLRRVSR
jgi:hypothetical protein